MFSDDQGWDSEESMIEDMAAYGIYAAFFNSKTGRIKNE